MRYINSLLHNNQETEHKNNAK